MDMTGAHRDTLESRMEERVRELGINWAEVIRRAGGLSRQNLLDVRRGTTTPRGDTRARIEAALELAPGGFEQMQRGEKPTPAAGGRKTEVAPAVSEDLAPPDEVLGATVAELAKLARLHAWYMARPRGGRIDPGDEERFMVWALQLRARAKQDDTLSERETKRDIG